MLTIRLRHDLNARGTRAADERRRRRRGAPPGLPGLCPVVPLAGGTTGYAGEPPDRIAFYREAVCASRRTGQEIREQDRRTAIHEAARRFGTDDRRLRELGWQSSSFHCVPRQPARSRTA
jgi:hypothetical protein